MTMHRHYAVIDFETTGFGSADRIVEIGVVVLDQNHEVTKKWETLVQPRRDIPNGFVHRISPSDLVDAPLFEEVAGELARILDGHTLVAHNASFEVRFLQNEFKRLGLKWPQIGAWIIDTQRLFRQKFPNEPTTLAHALERMGLSNRRPHSALADAEATAKLFSTLASESSTLVMSAAPLSLPPFAYPAGRTPLPRSSVSAQAIEGKGEWLARLSELLPHTEGGSAGNYRKALTAALADKELSKSEIAQLSRQAQADGLCVEDLLSIHEEFIRQIAIEAWLDGRITDEERATILELNEQLGLPSELANELLTTPQQGACDGGLQLSTGDRVTFTGQLDLPREEWEKRAAAVGLNVGGVTKKSALLVAAHPDSMSGKARKAREYGIPIVGEKVFAQLLQEMDDATHLEARELSLSEPSLELPGYSHIFSWSSVVPSVGSGNVTQQLAQQWCAEHSTRPLVEMSPHLTPTTPIDVQSSYKSGFSHWFARFPKPLTATARDLRDLPGVGKHKLTAMVEAVILAAIDNFEAEMPATIDILDDVYAEDDLSEVTTSFLGVEESPSVTAADLSVYVGWLQLAHPRAALASIPVAVKAEIPELVSHVDSAAPLATLFQRAAAEVSAAADSDERKIEIVNRRWVGDATLEEIGTEFGVTRERVRQLENQLRKDFDSHNDLFEAVVTELGQHLAPIRSVDAVRREFPALLLPVENFDCTFGELFTAVGNKWNVRNGWVLAPHFDEELAQNLSDLADEFGVLSLVALADSLDVTPELIEEFIVTNEKLKVLILDGNLLTKAGSYQDRAVAVLAINGEPMTAEEIMDSLGGGNYRSASNQFAVDPRLIRVSADQWALKEWGGEEFKNISGWIEERLKASSHIYSVQGGESGAQEVQAIPLDELLAEADRLRIAEASIRQYASLGEFETRDGMVFRRTDESANVIEGDIEDSRDIYWRDGSWQLLLTVNKDHLRGSGFSVPLGVAAYYGMQVNDTVTLASRLGEQYVRVNRLKQASISTMRRFLEQLGVSEGQRVWLKLGSDKSFDVTLAYDEQPGLSGLELLYSFVGLDPQLIEPSEAVEDSLARVNELLGLNAGAPRRRTVARFRHRRQDDIADLIQEL